MFIPEWTYLKCFKELISQTAEGEPFDRRHRAQSLPTFPADVPVRVDTPNSQDPGRVIE